MQRKLMAIAALSAGSLGAATQPLDGIWRSLGWGFVYQVRGDSWQAFEVTSATCVLGFQAERRPGSRNDEATFRIRSGDSFRVVADGDRDHKRLIFPTRLSSVAIERLDALPAVCSPTTPDTPLGNFEVFTRTFAGHYIAFGLRQMDWEKAVARNRLKITTQTTPAQLFEVLSAMIKPLADIHTGIEAPKLKLAFEAPFRAGTDRILQGDTGWFEKHGRRQLAAMTNRLYFRGSLLSLCRGQWQYGLADGGIGYLRILAFGDYSRREGYESNLQAMNHALDRILGDPNLRSLVIDLRLSFGGDDRLGLAIASRLTRREYLAYAIQARSSGTDPNRFTKLEPVFVLPGKQPVFDGRIAVLTGPITMSAAETFTQALMGRTPRVIRIGERTQGVFCDTLDRRLPNGWSFSLPNAIYRTAGGESFDAVGIPPDVNLPVYSKEDVAAKHDPVMAAAMRILREN